MTTQPSPHSRVDAPTFAPFAYGFRPFFFAAGAFAVLGLVLVGAMIAVATRPTPRPRAVIALAIAAASADLVALGAIWTMHSDPQGLVSSMAGADLFVTVPLAVGLVAHAFRTRIPTAIALKSARR